MIPTTLAHAVPHSPGEWLVLIGGLLIGALLVFLTNRGDDEPDDPPDRDDR